MWCEGIRALDYQRYQHSRNLSWEILTESRIGTLPVSLSEICADRKIVLKYYEEDAGISGWSMKVNEEAVILVNPHQSKAERRFIAAHELGHILLGHVGEADWIGRKLFAEDNHREQTADVFAGRLLAPACVLWGCGVRGPRDIMELCDVEAEVAKFRWRRLRELIKRDKFLTSPLERQVYEQFSDFIAVHRFSESEKACPLCGEK